MKAYLGFELVLPAAGVVVVGTVNRFMLWQTKKQRVLVLKMARVTAQHTCKHTHSNTLLNSFKYNVYYVPGDSVGAYS
jgi:hypothetical protein